MKVTTDNLTLATFEAWSGAKDTKQTILDNGKENEFDALIDELYPEGLTDTQLNDLLWFEEEFLYENLGIDIED